MLTHLSMKIVTHIFGYKICSIPNSFGFKMFNESIVLGFNLTLHMHTPPPGATPEGFQNEHLQKLTKLLWVSLNSMYGLRILAGDKINPKSMISPSTPDPLICRSPSSSMGVSISMLEHVTEIWDLRYTYQRLINDQLVQLNI